MGASDWNYRVPYLGGVEAALAGAQEQVLASGDYLWPWEGWAEYGYDGEIVPRPSSLADLTAAKEIDGFWEAGTHSILDVDRVIGDGDDTDGDDDDLVGAVRPLSPAELRQVFGTAQPSRADFDRVYQPGPEGPLEPLLGPRWTGRSVAIYEDGIPVEVYFWGYSGD